MTWALSERFIFPLCSCCVHFFVQHASHTRTHAHTHTHTYTRTHTHTHVISLRFALVAESLDLAADTWLLAIDPCGVSTWSYVNVSLDFPAPPARWSHASAIVHGTKLVVSGGYSDTRVLDDCWMLGG